MISKNKKALTRGETQIMRILWGLPNSQGYSAEIMAAHAEPKPALTTLLTFLKILTDKGYVSATKKQGKPTLFKALVSQDDYAGRSIGAVVDAYFGGSFSSLVSFFAQHEDLSDEEIRELKDLVGKL